MDYETIVEALENIDIDKKIMIWNDYCNDHDLTDFVYRNDKSFFEACFGSMGSFKNVQKAMRCISQSREYNVDDKFVGWDECNLISSNDMDALIYWNTDDIAEWILENNCFEDFFYKTY